jgi:hypothetical protein
MNGPVAEALLATILLGTPLSGYLIRIYRGGESCP